MAARRGCAFQKDAAAVTGLIDALHSYPIKGFSAQPTPRARLNTGGAFPDDRLMAVEIGLSGFNPAAPAHIPKMRFAVLARLAELARVKTWLEPSTRRLTAEAPGARDLEADLTTEAGRRAFERWLENVLADLLPESLEAPLRLLDGNGWRFLDHPLGHVSILNLATVRDLEARLGRQIDPMRFRANLHVDGWPAWAELEWEGRELELGTARGRVFKPIVRCAATEVNLETGVRDIDIPAELYRLYGHTLCGLYVHVEASGEVALGDRALPL
jgi:hypothetical protein